MKYVPETVMEKPAMDKGEDIGERGRENVQTIGAFI